MLAMPEPDLSEAEKFEKMRQLNEDLECLHASLPPIERQHSSDSGRP